ncbi:MAG: fused MFS/spermidine synthase [Gemmatimonadales bacterium]
MVLPLLGGSPAVWNTCLMYFQALLLLGYLYAHVSTRYLSVRIQVMVQVGFLALCLLVLPVALPKGWIPPPSGNVIPWLMVVLTVTVGAPFVALAATAPLLQRWLAGLDKPVRNPYVLYAASNAGSFIGLLAFPILLEPNLRLGDQSRLWTAVFAIAVILTAACGSIVVRRTRERSTTDPISTPSDVAAPTWRDRLKWTALAFVPSSLLLGVTTFLSTDVAATPLLWVIPLALYLLTFVIVFGRGSRNVSVSAAFLHAALVTGFALVFFWQANIGFRWAYALHLALFTLTALVLHGELAASRPAPVRLTEFYLWMAFGGALGGAFTALIVPLVFRSTLDYTMMLVIACFLRPSVRRALSFRKIAIAVVPALILAIGATPDVDGTPFFGGSSPWVISIVAAVIALMLQRDSIRFGVAVASISVAGFLFQESTGTLFSDRSFFGVYRVTRRAGPATVLYHGTTIHGAQFADSARRLRPVTYYHPNGPVGQVFQSLQTDQASRSVGVVGLGTGSLLCYSRPSEHWTFFEIDPHVEAIALNPRLFTFLLECAVRPRIVIGDARLTLGREPSARYSLLLLDAFSSDAIPVHLLTLEAFALYRRVLTDHGLLMVHISNRRLNLEPVVGALAASAGLAALIRNHEASSASESKELEYGSDWVVLARHSEDLAPLASDPRWRRLKFAAGSRPWTDDYSNLFSVIKW